MADVVFENDQIEVVVNSSDEVIVKGKQSGTEIRVAPMMSSLNICTVRSDMKISTQNGMPIIKVEKR